ncbi:hypothetical protein [Mesoaciditoga sp.]
MFEFLFLLLNVHAGWDIVDSLIRATVSASLIEFLLYLVYAIFTSGKKEKGRYFDKRDSKR